MTNDERSTNSRNRNNSPDRGIEYSLQRAVLRWGEARGRECIQGDTRPTEQRSPRAKRPLPEGLRRFWLVASLLVGPFTGSPRVFKIFAKFLLPDPQEVTYKSFRRYSGDA